MEKRIELEKRGRPANQITELNLDNCRSTNIIGLTDEFTALETLSLINVGLTTLKGFPKLPNLKKLELSDNRISNGLSNLVTSTKVTHLNLSGNKIKDLEELKPLENFKFLQVLDLFNNEATCIDSYREKIFALIPSLKYLDGFDANEVEALTDGDDDDELNGNETDGDDVSDDLGEDEDDDDEDGDEEEDDDDEEDNGDVSLAEVYNDDLEEDNSDYVEDAEGEEVEGEDDDDVESEEDGGANEKAPGQPQQPAEEESPARGKKRKHNG